jgi:Ca2+-binding RTX toxin-like protein
MTIRASGFIGSIGVDTHLSYTDGQYANVQTVISDMRYLGLTLVRDWAPNPALGGGGYLDYPTAAQAGIKFVLDAVQQSTPADAVARIHAFVASNPGSVVAIEGPNEVNNWPISYDGLTGTAAAQAWQADLYADIKADPLLPNLPVLGFTDYPDAASRSNWNNVHSYPLQGSEPYNTMVTDIAAQNAVDPGKPVAVTEFGYYTLPQEATYGDGVDDTTQAKLLLNGIFDAALLGDQMIFLYQLLDAYPDPTNSIGEDHFGLFDINNAPKPAAVAIHNLAAILSDTGAAAASFTTGTLGYTISGLPSTGHSLLLEKSTGAYDLAVWNEPQIWNAATHQPISVAAQTATVSLGAPYQTVEVFDPLASTTPVQVLHNVSSVTLGLTDHPLIIEVEPGSTSPVPTPVPTPAPTPVPTPTAVPTPTPTPGVTLTGGSGLDTLRAGTQNTTINGLGGDDSLFGGPGSDVLNGGPGNDYLQAGSGPTVMNGGPGNDYMVAGSGPDTFILAAGDGNDQIYGFKQGTDKLSFIDQTSTQVTYSTGSMNGYTGLFASYTGGVVFVQGVSSLTASDVTFAGSATQTPTPAPTPAPTPTPTPPATTNLVINGTNNGETLRATDVNTTINGLGGDDDLFGGAGSDVLNGGVGNDYIQAGSGPTTINGGPGNDYMVAGTGVDLFTLASGDGTDQIYGFKHGIDTLSFLDQTASQVTYKAGSMNGYAGVFASYTGGTVFIQGVSGLTGSDVKYHA